MPQSFPLVAHIAQGKSPAAASLPSRKWDGGSRAFSELYRRAADWPAAPPVENHLESRGENRSPSLWESEPGGLENNFLNPLDLLRQEQGLAPSYEPGYPNTEYFAVSPYSGQAPMESIGERIGGPDSEYRAQPERPAAAGPEESAQYSAASGASNNDERPDEPALQQAKNVEPARKDAKDGAESGAKGRKTNKPPDSKAPKETLKDAPKDAAGKKKDKLKARNFAPESAPKSGKSLNARLSAKDVQNLKQAPEGDSPKKGSVADKKASTKAKGVRVELIDERRGIEAKEPAKTEDGGKPGRALSGEASRALGTSRQGSAKAVQPGQNEQIRQAEDTQNPGRAPIQQEGATQALREPQQKAVDNLSLQPVLEAREVREERERAEAGRDPAGSRFLNGKQVAAALRVSGVSPRNAGQVALLRKRRGMEYQAKEGFRPSRSGLSDLSEGAPQSGAGAYQARGSGPWDGPSRQATVLRSFAQQMVQRLQEGPLAQNMSQLQFRLLEQNRGEIRLRLSPEHLGRLRIHLSVEGSQLSGRIMAESAEAARILQDHLPQLQDSLREGGFSGLNVSVGGENRQNSAPHSDSRVAANLRAAAGQSDEDLAPIWQLEQNQIDYSA